MGRRKGLCLATLTVMCAACALTGAAQASTTVSSYNGTLQVQRTYQAYFQPSGSVLGESNETVTFANAVFVPAASGGYTLQDAAVTYTRSPQTEAFGGSDCTLTWSQDTSSPPTGTITDGSNGWEAKLTVHILATDSGAPSCAGGPEKGLESWFIPLSAQRLNNGVPLSLSADGTQQYPASGSFAPMTDEDSGTLYANSVEWGKLKIDVKRQAAARLQQELDRAIAACDQKDARAQAYPITYYVFGGYSGVADCVRQVENEFRQKQMELDPPSPQVTSIALPGISSQSPGATPCGKGVKARISACRRVVAALRSYDTALAAVNGIDAAASTTLDRGNTAQAAGDSTDVQLQTAALTVYGALAHSAGAIADANARALASALASARVRLTVSGRGASVVAHQIMSAKLPSAVLRGLAADGIGGAALRAVLSKLAGGIRIGPLTLASTLRASTDPPALPSADLVLTPPELSQLIGGLVQSGAVDANDASRMQSALTAYETSTTSAASASALAGLHGDIAGLRGSAGTFLGTALTLL